MTIAETMRELADDCRTEAVRIDGRPFDSRNVAELFGNTLAMLSVVAKAVALLDEKIDAAIAAAESGDKP